MARFSAIDLKALPDPTALISLDHDSVVQARLAELEAQLLEVMDPGDVADIMGVAHNVPSSPNRYLQEAGAARELYVRNQINIALRSVLLATAQGNDLDHIGAGRGVARRILDDTDPDKIVYEGDDEYRARVQLAVEAYSPHGAEGSYVYWSLHAHADVADVAVYGPNHNLDPPLPPAEPLVVILSRQGDGRAGSDLLDTVYQNLHVDKRRPVADKVSVITAEPLMYRIEAILHVTTAASANVVQAAAIEAARSFVDSRLRIGRKIYRTSLAAAMTVQGVLDVDLVSPAADIEIGPFEAGYCSEVAVTMQSASGGWRDV